MSSRDRMNRPENTSPRSRARYSSEGDRVNNADRDFWDMDPEEPDDYPEDAQAPETQLGPTGRSRSAGPARGSTAEQIGRLRQSMARSRGSDSSSQQTLGRNYLSRVRREPAPVQGNDDWDDDDPGWEQPEIPRRTRRVADSDVRRGVSYVTESEDDSEFDDDERYYDDDDDFDEYDAPPRRTPLTRAPSVLLSRPNVARPVMPRIISQADLVNDAAALGMIGLGLLSLAAMAILVANRADTLAPSFATHVSASGVLEDFRGSSALWRLPLLSAMLTLMNIGAAWFISPIDRFASRFLIAAAILMQIVAWVALIRIL